MWDTIKRNGGVAIAVPVEIEVGLDSYDVLSAGTRIASGKKLQVMSSEGVNMPMYEYKGNYFLNKNHMASQACQDWIIEQFRS